MIKREKLIPIIIILIIFSTGFFIRLGSADLHQYNQTEKQQMLDQNALPYMYELDSYYNLRLTQNFLKNGHFGDQIKNNQSWDSLSYSPPGRPAEYPPLIVWLAAAFFLFVNLFTTMSLLDTSFWLPAFIGPLAGIVGYLFVRKYAGEFAGFVTGILIVTAPVYFMRTMAGFFDTDMFNILLPLLTVFFFSEAIETSKKLNMVIYTTISVFFLILFSLAWTGWSYIFYLMFFTGLIYILLCKIKKIKIKNFLEVFALFVGLSLVSVALTSGINGIIILIQGPLNFIPFLPGANSTGAWPNIYVSVGELHQPALDEFLSGAGPVNLGLGVFGIFVIASIMLRSKMRKLYLPNLSWFVFILIFVWISLASLAYYASARFAMLLIPSLAIFSGILIGIAIEYLKKSPLHLKNNRITVIASILLVAIICIPPIINIDQSYSVISPGANDDMANAAYWIKANTSNDTVIITDWSYGHFFTEYANRPVIFDGGSQNTPRAYWGSKAFSTDNETLSAGIMRMISYSGDDSYLSLENYTQNTSLTVEIMNNILGVSKNQARKILIDQYKISPDLTEKILNGTHPNNPRPFVIFTNDGMIYGGHWTFVFGDWNFDKDKGANYTYSGGFTNSTGNIKKYDNGAVLDLKNNKSSWNGKLPHSTIVVEKNKTTTFFTENKSDFCMIFLMEKKMVLVIDEKYRNSMFIKLVVLKQPTTIFKPIYKNNSSMIWAVK
jgi:dolichyl-diphosphooligosaccharide--protein glycosyltransferase